MRRTPPLAVELHPQPAVQAVVALIAALAVGGLAAWACSHQPSLGLLGLAVPVAAAWAWHQAAVQPCRLRWDGQVWWLADTANAEGAAVQIAVLIDPDRGLLLRATPGPRWLQLSRAQQTAHWGALRAMLFAAPGGAVAR